MGDNQSIHAVAWVAWALGGLVAVQVASSPLYAVLVGAIAFLVVETHAAPTGLARAFPVLVAAGLVFAGLRLALTAVTTHAGGAVLFTLPEFGLPRLLGGFTVGGGIETAVVLRAGAEGLVIVAIIAVFGAFNAVVSHYQLVRAAPRAFHELGLIVTVALAFVPSTLAAIAQVREADRARTGGRVVRRGRLLRTLVPVLEGGMEKAMNLAESMDARGFGYGGPAAGHRGGAWLSLSGLVALAAGFAALVAGRSGLAGLAGGLGLLLVVGAVAVVSRASGRPRYRRPRLGPRDLVVIASGVSAPAVLAGLEAGGLVAPSWLPGAGFPRFELPAAGAVLLLAVPAVLTGEGRGGGAGTGGERAASLDRADTDGRGSRSSRGPSS